MKGKDLMTAVYTYDELVKEYQDFRVPAAAIYIGNSKENVIAAKKAAVESIRITLSADQTAVLSFRIVNGFDLTTHSMQGEIKELFRVGKVIEAALGYGSSLTTVFKGYIAEYKTVYQEMPAISVTALDLRKLLMQSRRRKYKYAENTYSQIFSEVMGNYRKLYDTLHVDSVEQKEELTQNDTDYRFIRDELCRKGNREFFVVGKDVYFKKPEEEGSSFLELEWGKNLISFQAGSGYCNGQMKVYSCQEDKTWNTAQTSIKTGDDTPSLTAETQIEEWELGAGLDTQILTNWLDKKASEKKEKNRTAAGTLIGLPELVPGRYIKIKGVDSDDEGIYYLKEVSHSFDHDGFITSFSVGERGDRLTAGEAGGAEENRYRGMMRAVVKQNWDEEHPGKVLVDLLTGEEGKNSTKWLPVVQPYCGAGYGFYFHPEIDTEVIVGSLAGDVNSLVVMGSMWNEVDALPADTAGEKNVVKRIRTKGNHEIVFCDEEDAGKVQIHTNGKLNITLDDAKKTITVFDEEEKNGLQIDGEKGTLTLKADKKIILSAGDKEMIVVDGNGGKVLLEADKIEEKGKQNMQIQAQKLEIKGNVTEMKAEGSLKINSSAVTEIKGSMVKIN
ncbi:MAG: phage baseplate assembly protein V [Bacteroidales bacterium]|nr:phage baseplate assembly protein V [Clostridium sp.]MCM1203311.1 phage baseplate assembly protein V [Bacteroidales bacterium]